MKPLILAVLAALLPCSASAQVFKCVDANGKTTYSDNGCAAGHTTSTLAITPTKVSASEVTPYRIPPEYLTPPAPKPQRSRPRVTVVGDSGRSESEQRRRCREASTPHKGTPGLTASQLAVATRLCTGVDVPMPEPAVMQPYAPPAAPAPAAPAHLTHCDGTGCWDSNGGRYNRGAGDTHFPAAGGPACQLINGQMICP